MRKFMILLPIIFGFIIANFTAVSDGTYWMYIIQGFAIVFTSTGFGFMRFWKSGEPRKYMFAPTGIPLYIIAGVASYILALILQ